MSGEPFVASDGRTKYPDPAPVGEQVAQIRSTGLSQEQIEAFLQWVDEAYGEDTVLEGGDDGLTTIYLAAE